MEVREAMKKRRSVNSFLDKKVDLDIVAEILDIAKEAPSSGNLQNWKVVVIDDKDKKDKISSACLNQKWINQAGVVLVICNDYENVNKMYGSRGKDIYSVQNCAAFIQNILIAATDIGLASCWIGSFELDKVRMILKIPDDVRPEGIIALGYSDELKESTRYPINNFTFIDEYGNKTSLKPPAKLIAENLNLPKKGLFARLFRKK